MNDQITRELLFEAVDRALGDLEADDEETMAKLIDLLMVVIENETGISTLSKILLRVEIYLAVPHGDDSRYNYYGAIMEVLESKLTSLKPWIESAILFGIEGRFSENMDKVASADPAPLLRFRNRLRRLANEIDRHLPDPSEK
jgi:hypothetical protein